MDSYEHFRALLPIAKHRLDDELEVQAQIMEQISTEVSRKQVRMMECKHSLEKLEGRLATEFKEDDQKMTVAMIEAKVKRDPDRTKAWQLYLDALAEHSRWEGLRNAWRDKGFSIKTLADLYQAQYFQLSSTQTRDRIRRAERPAETTITTRRRTISD